MSSKILVHIFFTFLVMNGGAFAQKINCNIKRVYGFYKESIAGNMTVDMDGKPLKSPVSICYTMYVEATAGNSIKFDSVKIGGIQYAISSSSPETNFPINVGKLKNTAKSFLIDSIKGHQIFKIEVQYAKPLGDTTTILRPLVLKGNCSHHKIVYVVNNIQSLQTLLYP